MTAPSPKDLLGDPKKAAKRHAAQLERIRAEGVVEGREQARKELLDYLEWMYCKDPNRPDRDTQEARAILMVTKRAMEFIRTGKKA